MSIFFGNRQTMNEHDNLLEVLMRPDRGRYHQVERGRFKERFRERGFLKRS